MSTARLEPGARVVCTEPSWWNAYGDRFEEMREGYPGTVVDTKHIGGAPFLALEEYPDLWFWARGFKRRLDG